MRTSLWGRASTGQVFVLPTSRAKSKFWRQVFSKKMHLVLTCGRIFSLGDAKKVGNILRNRKFFFGHGLAGVPFAPGLSRLQIGTTIAWTSIAVPPAGCRNLGDRGIHHACTNSKKKPPLTFDTYFGGHRHVSCEGAAI